MPLPEYIQYVKNMQIQKQDWPLQKSDKAQCDIRNRLSNFFVELKSHAIILPMFVLQCGRNIHCKGLFIKDVHVYRVQRHHKMKTNDKQVNRNMRIKEGLPYPNWVMDKINTAAYSTPYRQIVLCFGVDICKWHTNCRQEIGVQIW